MTEIFKCLKGLSPPIINEIFRLKNIPYTVIRGILIVSCQRSCIVDLKLYKTKDHNYDNSY